MPRHYLAIPIVILLLARANVFAQPSTWTIDKNQTQVNFQIRRVPVSYVRGSFGGITGTVTWDETNVSKSSVAVVIPTASISTNNSLRDSDLKSSSFFNVEITRP
jgi:polyisoprenoid-binding protein YceI